MSRETSEPGRGGEPAHVLLVEDEALLALSERRLLERSEFRVSHVATGEAAVQKATEDRSLSLVLMDIDLGAGIDGTEAARRILAARDIPIVFLTGHAEREYVDMVRKITKYGYVLKNSGEFVLYESVRMALELFNLARELKRTRDLYKSVADLAGEIITRHDGDGKWIFVNAEARRVWGLGDRDIKSFHYFDFVHPDDRQATEEIRRRMERDHETVHGFVNRQQTVEGWRLYEWSSAPVLDDSGGFVGFQATGRDITDRDLSG